MKRKSLALLAIALTLTVSSFAQGFHLGIKGGTSIFKVDGKAFSEEYLFGYNFGAFAEINFSKSIGIQPEVFWSQTNFRTGDQFSDQYPGGKDDVKGKLNYLNIPVLLNVHAGKILTFQVGPQFGILVNDHKNLFENGEEAFKKGDFSMLGGAQVNLGALKIGGRYAIGLANINDIDNKEKWKNQGFQLYLGLKIL
jgi:hypothetical protein